MHKEFAFALKKLVGHSFPFTWVSLILGAKNFNFVYKLKIKKKKPWRPIARALFKKNTSLSPLETFYISFVATYNCTIFPIRLKLSKKKQKKYRKNV